jgi:tetratricopeptide (TPR) repeat protein/tRNA A-37 threonylcarbamoyl transferase component Bud32
MRKTWEGARGAIVEELFLEAAELSPDTREDFVRARCGDRQLCDEVLSLLRYDLAEESPLLDALTAGASSIVGDEALEGQMLGPYRVEREIGRGGMSVVYSALRADGEFHKRVAIKLIKRGMDTRAVVERLRRERGILAALEHPSIARLLDGGTTPDGRPWIAMEYVEGLPIDRFCAARGLSVEDRCELIAKVCDAVAYAHRNLVVHRDLKPSNVLIAPDGSPKLLDFGIAKLLDEGGEDGADPLTRGFSRPFTPEYASPEQLSGGSVQTTTDVYSLAVVLYELLTGERPGQDPEKASAAALRTGRGKRWARRISGDLDNILAMALRAEPERRYLSIGQLQSDLRLHLEGKPVAAHRESLWYRSRRFLARHRLVAVAALLVLLSLAGGIATTFWQARRAEEERRIADRRFDQVRALAKTFLFDFDAAIAPLPGSTSARKMIVDTGIRYYDSLVPEAAGNKGLLEEIARGYDRLGDVQGNFYYANLGDTPGAEATYRKALAIRSRIADTSPAFMRDRVEGYLRLGEILLVRGDPPHGIPYLRQAVALGGESGAAQSREMRESLARAWSRLGDALSDSLATGDALEAYSKMLALRLGLAREKDSPATRLDVGLARTKLAILYEMAGRPAESVEHLRQAIPVFRALSADTADATALRYLCIASQTAANVLRAEPGREFFSPSDIAGQLQSCVADSRKLVAADPMDQRALVDLIEAETDLGEVLYDRKQTPRAVLLWNEALAGAQRLSDASSLGTSGNEMFFIELYRKLAMAASDAGRFGEALEYMRKAERMQASVVCPDPECLAKTWFHNEIAGTRADIYAAAKNRTAAIAEIVPLIASEEALAKRDPDNRTPANDATERYAQLARCYFADGQAESGVQALKIALERYNAAATQYPLTPVQERRRRADLDLLAVHAGN